MSGAEPRIHFDVLAITATTAIWQPVRATIECARVVIENPGEGSVFVRTRVDGSSKRIRPDAELDINAAVLCFLPGDTVCEIKADTIETEIVVTFTR